MMVKNLTMSKLMTRQPPENRDKPSGRGIFLMKKLADEVVYTKKGKCVTLTLM